MDEFEVVETSPGDMGTESAKHAGGFSRLASLVVGGAAVVGGSIVGSAVVPGVINQANNLENGAGDSAFADTPTFNDPTSAEQPAAANPFVGGLNGGLNARGSGVSFFQPAKAGQVSSSAGNTVALPNLGNLNFGNSSNATSAWNGSSSGSGTTTSTTTSSTGSGAGGGTTTNTTQTSGGGSGSGSGTITNTTQTSGGGSSEHDDDGDHEDHEDHEDGDDD